MRKINLMQQIVKQHVESLPVAYSILHTKLNLAYLHRFSIKLKRAARGCPCSAQLMGTTLIVKDWLLPTQFLHLLF